MPQVTIIVPCYNEQSTIGQLLEAIYAQTYPRHDMEVVIADGLSTDNTRHEIAKFQQDYPDLNVQVVENPKRSIPAGLNQAIENARGEIVVRLDAHSFPYPDYVARCVEVLQSGVGENVGGVWEIQPGAEGWLAKSIAAAAAHPLGAGDARYRIGGAAQSVDTVPFGAFRKTLPERIGYYDETLLTNEDYEFNVRIRRSGGRIWLDPTIRTRYAARPTLRALWKQYWRYGYWKAKMLKRYPHTLRWRQVIPPLFVLSLFLFLLVGIFFPVSLRLLALELFIYFLVLGIAAGLLVGRRHFWLYLLGAPSAWVVIHLAWGSSVLWGLITSE